MNGFQHRCLSKDYALLLIMVDLRTPFIILPQRRRGAEKTLYLNFILFTFFEFELGMGVLKRFVREEPLYRAHERVFGVLALESEPVCPRLQHPIVYFP